MVVSGQIIKWSHPTPLVSTGGQGPRPEALLKDLCAYELNSLGQVSASVPRLSDEVWG